MIKTHKFNGKRYKLFFSADADGSCDSPLGKAERTIEVNVPLNSERGCQVLVHEALHAADWRKPEKDVREFADTFGVKLYKRLGKPEIKNREFLQSWLWYDLNMAKWRKTDKVLQRISTEIGDLVWRLIKSGQLG